MTTKIFEVCLRGGAPWGFRLTGGKEFRTSLRVSKVEESGKAEAEGICVNDEIIAINGTDVLDLYHTAALALVRKAGNQLVLLLNRTVSGGHESEVSPNNEVNTQPVEKRKQKMIEITAYRPSANVPMKPVSATSVPQSSIIHTDAPAMTYDYQDEYHSEWSPDIINDVTRVPDQIVLDKRSAPEQNEEFVTVDINQDVEERRKRIPQAPTSPHGFDKVKPKGRGSRRLTNSSISSVDMYEPNISENQPEVFSTDRDSDGWWYTSNNALRHLQYNKAQADEDVYKRTSSLPRSLGRRKYNAVDQYRSATLPRKKPDDMKRNSGAPAWYKEMYREINKSMEGQSNLSRLLSADAKKGAFRRYDGATATMSSSPRETFRQRPKSVHVDHFPLDDLAVQDRLVSKDDLKVESAGIGLNHEKRRQRHSVQSAWYREFQRGGKIPTSGLATDQNQETLDPIHMRRSRSSDNILSNPVEGLPYQTTSHRSTDDMLKSSAKFEYSNPPDFLELRKQAEADGALRDDREREMKMVRDEKLKWLKNEEDLNVKREAAKIKAEEEKKMTQLESKLIEQKHSSENRGSVDKGSLEAMEGEKNKHGLKTVNSQEMKGLALYSFNSQSPVEISFRKGQLLHIIRQIDENWYEGGVDDRIGIFPVNYIQICKNDEAEFEQFPKRVEIEEGFATAKYTFLADSSKELSFKKNEEIVLLRHLDENWYEAEISDRIGIVPKNYLKVLKEPRVVCNEHQRFEETSSEDGSQSVKDCHSQSSSNSNQNYTHFPSPERDSFNAAAIDAIDHNHERRRGEKYKSLFSYQPINADEIELMESDIVYVLEQCDDGWFVGVCERTGKFGTFPGNYVVPF